MVKSLNPGANRPLPGAWREAAEKPEPGLEENREEEKQSARAGGHPRLHPVLSFYFVIIILCLMKKHSHSILCRPCVSRSFDQIYLYNILDQLNGGELIGIQMHSRHTLQPDTIHNASLKTLRTGWLIGFKAQLHPV